MSVNERVIKINDISDEVLKELYVKYLELYKERLTKEIGDFDTQEYASGLMALAVNFSGNILSRICNLHPSIEIEGVYMAFMEMLSAGLRKVNNMKSSNVH